MIDRTALLATLKPVVTDLEDSIRERALTTPEVEEHLEREHNKAVTAERTAMSLEEWREGEITQAAVAWVLACVFVRFLEDNRLIDQPLIAGPGQRGAAALGHRSVYFQREPGHSDREYLESCFREVAAFPAVTALYDERHNPLWRLGPTADGARELRETFTRVDPETGELVHDFTDPDLGTRFLGDLYQDLSEAAKKRYALLQTPDFVEEFILDRTLTPAIAEFGLQAVRLIDPTCGSGHFLLGAFERLFALWREREPGTAVEVLAQRCLDQIAGVDLNPYATAIARFRLVVQALKVCAIQRLAESPAFTLNLATGDSLLHGPLPFEGAAMLFDAGRLDRNIAHVYESEDAAELKRILGRGYHAVVGNPPYIAVDDDACREAYRKRYEACHGQFVLTVPFMERFFELAQVRDEAQRNLAGFVGKITGSSFMKREFGAPLVERYLPRVDTSLIVDTSGAYLPGHGTPTVLVFGRSRQPTGGSLRVLDCVSKDPGGTSDPAQAPAWQSIRRLATGDGSDAFIRSSLVRREALFKHPMMLGIGRELLIRIATGRSRVRDRNVSVGAMCATREDAAYYLDPHCARTFGLGEFSRPVLGGDAIRDWVGDVNEIAVFPYTDALEPVGQLAQPLARLLWPLRAVLRRRRDFGGTMDERGLAWYAFSRLLPGRVQAARKIAWGEIATHTHFAVVENDALLNMTSPMLEFPPDTDRAEVLALAGVLNSSTIAFHLKQTCQPKGAHLAQNRLRDERYAFNAENIKDLPLPSRHPAEIARPIDEVAQQRADLLDAVASDDDSPLVERFAELKQCDAELTGRLVSLQEELDWSVLAAYELVDAGLPIAGESAPPVALGERAFEIVLARQVAAGQTETTWFERHGSTPITEVPSHWPAEYRAIVEQRIALIESDPDVGLIERPEHKRRWNRAPWEKRVESALAGLVLDALEAPELWADLRPRSTAELTDHLRMTPRLVEALELLAGSKDADLGATVARLVTGAAVPRLAAQRFTEKGLAKHAVWQQVWELQRAEDRGEEVGTIPVPPRYGKPDFRSGVSWEHRGKLDVPKERFVLIPGAERGADSSAVVGWAGWDEKDLARALAGRVTELRDQDAADAERVAPLLAAVLELLPWIDQWHPDGDPLFAGPPGAFFESWLDGQLAELSITRETLLEWRPPAPTRGRKAKAPTA